MTTQQVSENWIKTAKSKITHGSKALGLDVKSSHITESLAAALGFGTNASLRVGLSSNGSIGDPGIDLFLFRMSELYPTESRLCEPAFLEMVRKAFAESSGHDCPNALPQELRKKLQGLFEAMKRDQVERFIMKHALMPENSPIPFGVSGLEKGTMNKKYLASLKGPGHWGPYFGEPDADDLALEYKRRGIGPVDILTKAAQLVPRDWEQSAAEFCTKNGFWIGVKRGDEVERITLFSHVPARVVRPKKPRTTR